jgi:hypothetical protein
LTAPCDQIGGVGRQIIQRQPIEGRHPCHLEGWNAKRAASSATVVSVTPQFNRQVLVYVRDADNHLVEGSTIRWKENGQDRGSIEHSDGHGTLTPVHQDSIVEVTVEYDGLQPQTRTLAVDQTSCTIVFPNLHVHPTTWIHTMEGHFPAFAGIFFILIAIALAFVFSSPTLHYRLISY